jgi:hypothetical protein
VRDVAALGQGAIAGVTVDLQHARKAGQMRERTLRLAVGRIKVDDPGRIDAAPGPVVSRISPELAGLGSPASGIENGRRGFVGEQLSRALQSEQ